MYREAISLSSLLNILSEYVGEVIAQDILYAFSFDVGEKKTNSLAKKIPLPLPFAYMAC